MDTLEFDFFFEQLKIGKNIDETCFYFIDDECRQERCLGYLPQYDKPYWVGYCDILDGAQFGTADELINAPIFAAQSLKKRWNDVRFLSIQAVSLDIWLSYFKHA